MKRFLLILFLVIAPISVNAQGNAIMEEDKAVVLKWTWTTEAAHEKRQTTTNGIESR
jgi:hypothetical protein